MQVIVGERLNYVELLSAAQCDPENDRGSSLPACDYPVLKHFSLARDPEPTPWDLSNRRSDPLPGKVKNPNDWIQQKSLGVQASSLVPTLSSLGTHCS
jgi:hypothetical protein